MFIYLKHISFLTASSNFKAKFNNLLTTNLPLESEHWKNFVKTFEDFSNIMLTLA